MLAGDVRRSPIYSLSPSLGALNCVELAKRQKKYLEKYAKTDKVSPVSAATEFYVYNALVAKVLLTFGEHQPVPGVLQEMVTAYNQMVSSLGPRLFWYITSICQQEMRHIGGSGLKVAQSWKATDPKAAAVLGVPMSTSIFQDTPPDMLYGHFATRMEELFQEKVHWGSAFGGPPWAAIQLCARQFAEGKVSLEAMVDTAWTLAHNTAPMFNKGHLFHRPDTDDLHFVLDLQRAGQLVEAVRSKHVSLGVEHLVQFQTVFDLYPGWFGSSVDWEQVLKSNPIGSRVKAAAGKTSKKAPNAGAGVTGKKFRLDHQGHHYLIVPEDDMKNQDWGMPA